MKRFTAGHYPFNSTVSALAVAALLFVSACGGETDTAELEMPDTSAVGEIDMMPMAAADTVDVHLSEFSIEMPASVAAGNRVFRVVNDGSEAHSLQIEGVNVQESTLSSVAPGEEGTLQVNLQPGTYEAYCPDADHAEQGMRVSLQVTDEHGGTVSDTSGSSTGDMLQDPQLAP